jgi:hypothetical protein
VHRFDVVLARPCQRVAERPDRVIAGEHPRRRTGDAGGAAGKGGRRAVLDPEVASDERAEPEVGKGGGALGIEGRVERRYDDFLRRP